MILSVSVCVLCCCKKLNLEKDGHQIDVEANRACDCSLNRLQHNERAIPSPPGVQMYENVDPLSLSTVKTTHLYENIPTVISSPHQINIEMNQCTAYGVLRGTH